MNFGIPVDDAYLKTLSEYKDRKDLTAKDRSDVALKVQSTYLGEATKWLETQKSSFGDGVTTLCRVYNASGDALNIAFSHTYNGQFYKNQPPNTIQNGQWATFVHVKPPVAMIGSVGCVVYRTGSDTDVFVGWRNPYIVGKTNTTWCESQGKGHWWTQGSEDFMEYLLNNTATNSHEETNLGYKVKSTIGDSPTAYCEAIITKV